MRSEFTTGELAYDGQYAWSQSDAYQVFVICIRRTNFPGPIESVISKFTCIMDSQKLTAFYNMCRAGILRSTYRKHALIAVIFT